MFLNEILFEELIKKIETYLDKLASLDDLTQSIHQAAWIQTVCYLGEAFTFLRDQPESIINTTSIKEKSRNYPNSTGLIRDIIWLRNYFLHQYAYDQYEAPEKAETQLQIYQNYMKENLQYITNCFKQFKQDNDEGLKNNLTLERSFCSHKKHKSISQESQAFPFPYNCLFYANQEIQQLHNLLSQYPIPQQKKAALKNNSTLSYAASHRLVNLCQFYKDYSNSFQHYLNYEETYTDAENKTDINYGHEGKQLLFIDNAEKYRSQIIHTFCLASPNKIIESLSMASFGSAMGEALPLWAIQKPIPQSQQLGESSTYPLTPLSYPPLTYQLALPSSTVVSTISEKSMDLTEETQKDNSDKNETSSSQSPLPDLP